MYDYSTSSNQVLLLHELQDINDNIISYFEFTCSIITSLLIVLILIYIGNFIKTIFFGGVK